jgi:hypothetical protein
LFSPQPVNVNGFVTGKLDTVADFYCEITLQNWKETDCCWEKHAKCTSECIFVISVKGIQFVLDRTKTTGAIYECCNATRQYLDVGVCVRMF